MTITVKVFNNTIDNIYKACIMKTYSKYNKRAVVKTGRTGVKMKSSKLAISENIKFYREAAGLTQTELAERTGFSQQQISFWESGKNEPMSSAIDKIARALGIDLDNLLDSTGSVVVEFFVDGRDLRSQVFQRNNNSPKIMKKKLEDQYGVGKISIIGLHPNIPAPILVARNLKRLRSIFRMNIKDLARRSGLTILDIEQLESGDANIDYDSYNENNVKLDKIASSFNIVSTNCFLDYCE